MKKSGRSRWGDILLAVVCVLAFAACGKEETGGENSIQVYYINNAGTKVEMHPHVMTSQTGEEQLEELLECLSANPDKLEYRAPLSLGFQILGKNLENERIQIDVDKAYKELPAITEVLVRAAITRTLTQLPDISYVSITVEGEQLFDSMDNQVGWMSADQFIDNDGNEINTYELAKIKLYFADESGTSLIAANREKHYSTNTPMERFVVEELIAGPTGQVEGLYPSINPSTKIVNVMTKDGICYVNLDESFLTVVNNVSTDLSIYAIVNSLVELSNINRVQILINGEVPASFSAASYERNLDIVTVLER